MSISDSDLLQKLILQIFRLDDLLKDAANQITLPAGQTGARWQVLNALAGGPKTVSETARQKNVTRQSVQRIVNELASESVVRLVENPKHKRFPRVELTPRGQKLLIAIQKKRDKWQLEVFKALESSDLESLIDPKILVFLETFQTAVEQTLNKKENL